MLNSPFSNSGGDSRTSNVSPGSGSSGSNKTGSGNLGEAGDVLDLLNTGDEDPGDENDSKEDDADKKDEKSRTKTRNKDTRDDDEDDNDDDKNRKIDDAKDDDNDDEDKIDLKDISEVEIDSPPRKKEIEKLYPGIFKKLPFLEKMIYRDRQMQELFGSFDDATEAHGKAEALDKFEEQLLSGNPEELFDSVKKSDGKAFSKLVNNLLPTLAKVDKEAYHSIVSDIVQRVIVHMVSEGKNMGNDDLQKAALLVNQFVFGTSDFKARPNRDEPQKDDELEREKASFREERLNTAVNDLQLKVGNILKNTIGEYIDPRGQMSSFVKKNAIREALEAVDGLISQDTTFRKHLNRLWQGAERDKLTKISIDRIRSAYLGKAKGLLPTAIKKARNEALKELTPSRKETSDSQESDTPSKDRRNPIIPGRSTPHERGKSEMKKGESVMDFLMRD